MSDGLPTPLADAVVDLLKARHPVPVFSDAVDLEAAMRAVLGSALAGSKEASTLLGIERGTVGRWLKEGYLPPPIQRLASGPVWLVADLALFKARHAERADGAGRRPVGTA